MSALEELMHAALAAPTHRRDGALAVLRGQLATVEPAQAAPSHEPYLTLRGLHSPGRGPAGRAPLATPHTPYIMSDLHHFPPNGPDRQHAGAVLGRGLSAMFGHPEAQRPVPSEAWKPARYDRRVRRWTAAHPGRSWLCEDFIRHLERGG